MKEDARVPEPAPSARDDVRLAINRCPFCHEDVAVADAAAVVCRQCLARHHGGCWSESQECSSCRGTDALVALARTAVPVRPQPARPLAKLAPRSAALSTFLMAAGVVLVIVVLIGALVALNGVARANEDRAWQEAVARHEAEARAQEVRRFAREQAEAHAHVEAAAATGQATATADVAPTTRMRLHPDDRHAPSVFPEGFPIDRGSYLLLSDGQHFGAVVFMDDHAEGQVRYRFYYRSSSNGTLIQHWPGVESAERTVEIVGDTLPEIECGPLRFRWAPRPTGGGFARWGEGSLFFGATYDHPAPNGVNPADPERLYVDATGHWYSTGR